MTEKTKLLEKLHAFTQAADRAAPSIWIERHTAEQLAADLGIRTSSGPIRSSASPASGSGNDALEGKLVAVKDNIDAAGFATTAACPAFAYRPERSAVAVERVQAAGAMVVGKTNLDQFACGLVGTRSPYGIVPNPFNSEYISGGSSSGSAVAVALGLVDFSLGTDTAGSGRVPAGFNNIVGLKPSRGLISSRGMLPACQHLDCISIFTRTVPEAIEALHVMAGYDPNDPFARMLKLDARAMPETFRFGMPDPAHLKFYGDTLAEAAFREAIQRLKSLGGEPHGIDFAPMAAAATALYEEAWVAERHAAIRNFFDVQPQAVEPVVRTIIESGKRYSATDLFQAMVKMSAWRQQALPAWNAVDVLVVPTAPTIYRIREILGDPLVLNRTLGTYTNFVNLLDLAAIAVPSSIRPDGLPFGITLIGPAGSELRLADLAQRYHQSTGLRLGATEHALPTVQPIEREPGSTVQVAVVGAHLSGLPLNHQLRERGAFLVKKTRTAPKYCFYALPGTVPLKPGLVRALPGQASGAIEAEIWEMPLDQYGSFVAAIPAPLGIGNIEMADGSTVQGFVCEAVAIQGALDITSHGGWRSYLAALAGK